MQNRNRQKAMIRKVTEKDRESILEYLAQEPPQTQYIVADIKDCGFKSPSFCMWAEFSDRPGLPFESVFCLYYDCFLLYSHRENIDLATICQYILQNEIHFETMTGKESQIAPLANMLQIEGKIHRCHLAELHRENFIPHRDDSVIVEEAFPNDIPELFELRSSIEEFQDIQIPMEQLVDLLQTKKGRVLFIRQGGKIVCSATETSAAARIGYVCTLPEWRGRGFASLLVSIMSRQLLDKSMTPSLGYENPAAGRIYQRIGYREVGRTAIISKWRF